MAFTLSALDYTLGSPTYTAQQDRLMMLGMAGTEGVRLMPTATTGELAVATTGAANGSVTVTAGHIIIAGASGQGAYYAYNDASVTVGPLAANSSGNPRIDVIVARVTDSATPSITLAILQGTPAASPTAPTVTKTTTTIEVALAQIAVPNGFTTTTTIVAGNITDVRPRAFLDAAQVPATTAAGIATQVPSPQIGQMVIDGNGYLRKYDGATWAILLASGTSTPTLTNMAIGSGGSAVNTATWTYAATSSSTGVFSVTGRIVFGTTSPTFPTASHTVALTPSTPASIAFTASSTSSTDIGGANAVITTSGNPVRCILQTASTFRFFALSYNPTSATNPLYVGYAAVAATIPATFAAGDSLNYACTVNGSLTL